MVSETRSSFNTFARIFYFFRLVLLLIVLVLGCCFIWKGRVFEGRNILHGDIPWFETRLGNSPRLLVLQSKRSNGSLYSRTLLLFENIFKCQVEAAARLGCGSTWRDIQAGWKIMMHVLGIIASATREGRLSGNLLHQWLCSGGGTRVGNFEVRTISWIRITCKCKATIFNRGL